jgi:hypothetical protein
MLDIRILYSVVEITDYSFFTIEQFCLDFENLNVVCLRPGDLSHVIRPHSLTHFEKKNISKCVTVVQNLTQFENNFQSAYFFQSGLLQDHPRGETNFSPIIATRVHCLL